MSYDFKKNLKDLLIEHKKAKGLLKEQSPHGPAANFCADPNNDGKDVPGLFAVCKGNTAVIKPYTGGVKPIQSSDVISTDKPKEIAPTKGDLLKVKYDIRAHRDNLCDLGMLVTTGRYDPKKAKKWSSTRKRCEYWGPLVDLTATRKKMKEKGFFFGRDMDEGDWRTKYHRWPVKKAGGAMPQADYVPKEYVVLQGGAWTKNWTIGTEIEVLDFPKNYMMFKKDVGRKIDGKDIKKCPPKHKCMRKCYQGGYKPVSASGIPKEEMVDLLTFAPAIKAWNEVDARDSMGMPYKKKISVKAYEPGTKYATQNWSEGVSHAGNAKIIAAAAKNTKKLYGYDVFMGIYAPAGTVVYTQPYKKACDPGPGRRKVRSSIQFFVTDKWSNGPKGAVYPALLQPHNPINGKPYFAAFPSQKVPW